MELRELKTDEGWRVEFVHEGRSVSRTFIYDRRMRIGGAVVTMGGIGGVGTDEEYRHRGLARRVLERCVEVMEREEYDTSFLFGIQDFYHRFGFATCMGGHEVIVGSDAAARSSRRHRIRPARRSDLQGLVRLYNRENATLTASCVRPNSWAGFTRGTQWDVGTWVRVVVDGADRICGYVVCDDTTERCKVAEVCGSGDDVHHTILNVLSRRAARHGLGEIRLSLPAGHGFGLFLRQRGCTVVSGYPRNAGAMGRVIHLRPFMKALLPVLDARWGDGEGELGLATDIGTGAIRRARRGGDLRLVDQPSSVATCLRLGQDVLMQLACGYRTVEDCWSAGQLRGALRARRFGARLFPPHDAHMWWSDRF